jgi:hypothetical protein
MLDNTLLYENIQYYPISISDIHRYILYSKLGKSIEFRLAKNSKTKVEKAEMSFGAQKREKVSK